VRNNSANGFLNGLVELNGVPNKIESVRSYINGFPAKLELYISSVKGQISNLY